MPEQVAMLVAIVLIAALWAALTRVLRSGLSYDSVARPDRRVAPGDNRPKRAGAVWPVRPDSALDQRS